MAARPAQAHGSIALDRGACTSCNLCVVECPTWCITLIAHTDEVAGPGRARQVKVLDEFEIDFGLCMYCGICVDVCPFDALRWVPGAVSPALPDSAGSSPLVEGIHELAARATLTSGSEQVAPESAAGRGAAGMES